MKTIRRRRLAQMDALEPVVGQATETDLARDRTIRVGPMPLMPTAGARRIDSHEGRRQ